MCHERRVGVERPRAVGLQSIKSVVIQQDTQGQAKSGGRRDERKPPLCTRDRWQRVRTNEGREGKLRQQHQEAAPKHLMRLKER